MRNIGDRDRNRFATLRSLLKYCVLCAVISVSPLDSGAVFAQQAAPADKPAVRKAALPSLTDKEHQAKIDAANRNTIYLVSGNVTATFLQLANDLAFAFGDENELRVMPVVGKGASQNLLDVLRLKGIDLGFVRADTIEELRKVQSLPHVEKQIAYIAVLANAEVQIIGPKAITDLRQLEGKKVAIDIPGSGANTTGKMMFEKLGINAELLEIDAPQALDRMRKGEVSAVVYTAVPPIRSLETFDPGDKFHMINVQYDPRLGENYVPSVISSELYPKLVPANDPVNTIGVPSLLVTYNWPEGTDRYRRVAQFVGLFFDQYDRLKAAGRHPSWTKANLAADMPGWTRFKPAQAWLDAHAGAPTKLSRNDFDRYLETKGASAKAEDRQQLFEEFLAWQRKRTQ